MRKIISKKEEAKKQQKNQVILGLILVGVMFLSVLGYAFSGSSGENKKTKYNEFEFFEKDGLWYSKVQNSYFIFRYNPYEVDDIESEIKPISFYYNEPLYLFSESNEASYEISNNFEKIVERIQPACIDEGECSGDFPVKTCENNFIIIKENNSTDIIQNESCVFIYGSYKDLTKITDEFLFKVLGIKE